MLTQYGLNNSDLNNKVESETEVNPFSILKTERDAHEYGYDDKTEICSCSNLEIKRERDQDYNKQTDDSSLENKLETAKKIYDAYINEVKAMADIPILKSISEDFISNFRHYNTRYYEDKYCIDFGVTETGYCDTNIRIHSNKLFLIALASGNDIIRSQKDISEINFVVNNSDRSNVQLRGKKKLGSKSVEHHTILCQVKYQGDDKMYNIRAGINGRILEINELVKRNPNLIRTDPKGLGFIAIIAPQGKPADYEKRISKLNLLSEEKYFEYLLHRAAKFSTTS
ncbi:hypothetical protein NQ314_013832 [Rhamnusium bicolor]|uniref:Protein Abitram n=1 Tax=Rhamnusium bicolor TaxID=1586634 RepID=A0AAV8X4U7_9CUCU|nr:hypothetical protein NQ314_013832 [Rhamnusium bicolor]